MFRASASCCGTVSPRKKWVILCASSAMPSTVSSPLRPPPRQSFRRRLMSFSLLAMAAVPTGRGAPSPVTGREREGDGRSSSREDPSPALLLLCARDGRGLCPGPSLDHFSAEDGWGKWLTTPPGVCERDCDDTCREREREGLLTSRASPHVRPASSALWSRARVSCCHVARERYDFRSDVAVTLSATVMLFPPHRMCPRRSPPPRSTDFREVARRSESALCSGRPLQAAAALDFLPGG
mmetsp:Transcript_48496/g.155130  ORF Transcript_48496/g.155130 Transcript_48496/m.155130 type:complete len:239 (+) Transcript_48496:966-1682(+)